MSKTDCKDKLCSGEYINFKFDVPEGAEHADKLYVRLVAGTERADGKKENQIKKEHCV